MKWAHLPESGGLYNQDPDLLDAFSLIFALRAKHDAEEREKEKRQNKKNQLGNKRIAGRRTR